MDYKTLNLVFLASAALFAPIVLHSSHSHHSHELSSYGGVYYPPASLNYEYGINPYYSPHGAVEYYSPYDEWFYINSGISFQLDAPYTLPNRIIYGSSYPTYRQHSFAEEKKEEADFKANYGNEDSLVTPMDIQRINEPRSRSTRASRSSGIDNSFYGR